MSKVYVLVSIINLKIKEMNTRQRVRLNMLLTVRNCVTQNEAVAKNIPKFMEHYLSLQSTANEIQEIGKLQGIDKTGVAADKNKLKKTPGMAH